MFLCFTDGKTRTKDKYRVVYTDHQRLELEKEFHYSKYITIRRKAELATALGLSERQVRQHTKDDIKSCYWSGLLKDLMWSVTCRFEIKCSVLGSDVHVPLRMNCSNFGEPLTLHLAHHQVNMCKTLWSMTKHRRTTDTPISLSCALCLLLIS